MNISICTMTCPTTTRYHVRVIFAQGARAKAPGSLPARFSWQTTPVIGQRFYLLEVILLLSEQTGNFPELRPNYQRSGFFSSISSHFLNTVRNYNVKLPN